MTDTEKLTITLLHRLFWLVTQANGVARDGSDVKLFTEAALAAGAVTEEWAQRIIADYNREER